MISAIYRLAFIYYSTVYSLHLLKTKLPFWSVLCSNENVAAVMNHYFSYHVHCCRGFESLIARTSCTVAVVINHYFFVCHQMHCGRDNESLFYGTMCNIAAVLNYYICSHLVHYFRGFESLFARTTCSVAAGFNHYLLAPRARLPRLRITIWWPYMHYCRGDESLFAPTHHIHACRG
jgi:hypothetical protein